MVAAQRGFGTAADHDQKVIARWNAVVTPDDLVWHLGDVGLGNDAQVMERVAQLNGRIQLITGNHDPCWPGHRDARKRQRRWLEVFESVQAFARVRLGARFVLLSHFPYEHDHTAPVRHTQFRLRDEGLWLLHGHTHAKERLGPHPRYHEVFPGPAIPRGREVHVGLDAWSLQPAGEAEVIGVIREYEDSQRNAIAAPA